jgi:ATP-binding cassette, subfamily B, bacterial
VKFFLRTYQFFRPDQSRLLVVALMMIGSVGFFLLKPWPIAIVVDSVLGQQAAPAWLGAERGQPGWETQLIVLVGLTFVIHLLGALLTAAYNRIAIGIGLKGLRRVRLALFEKLQILPLRNHLGHRQGDLIQRAAWDTYSFQTLFQHVLVTGVTASLSLVLMVVVMARLNVPLTLVSLGTIPFLLLVIKLFGRRMGAFSAAAQEADSGLASRVQQNISAVTLIRSYTREPVEISQFDELAQRARERRREQHTCELSYLAVLGIIFGGGIAAILWMGSRQVMVGQATIGELIVFLTYLTQFYEPLNQLSNVGSTVSAASAGANRVYEVLDQPGESSEERDQSGAEPPLAIDEVTFGFDSGKPVLHGVSLNIEPGETVALVGPSGSGKSTLLKLLLRFHEPDSGRITAAGKPLSAFAASALRRSIAYVEQEPLLLPGSLADNISLGKPDASRAEIENAAAASCASGFIAGMDGGFDTVVGEGAARLSTGEGQRVSLARVFLKECPIVLLDEPTSALDAENEAAVAESLNVLCQGRTAIIASHRPEVLKFARRVVVLDAGRIVADGRPDEVRARNEFFRRMSGGSEPAD